MNYSNREPINAYFRGMKDGLPIGAGYFAVAFSLGIMAKKAGLTAVQGFVASVLTIASAGEYAGFTMIGAGASLLEMALVILVTNGRYLLMSCAMSQRINPHMNPLHRVGMGLFITDEIFGVSIAQKGYLRPTYTYGLASVSVLPWALGTSFGIIMGNVLPSGIVSALSVALYGMFLAIIIPPARHSKTIAVVVLISFLTSFLTVIIPIFGFMSEGVRIIVLTVIISSVAALLRPVKDDDINSDDNKKISSKAEGEVRADA